MSVATEAASGRPADAVASKADERRAIGVACGAHALHDGYTDLIYVMLPLWQAEFGIGYAALGLLRTCYSGTMAGFQIPSALLSERLGLPLVLAARHRAVGHRLSDRRRQRRLLDPGGRAPDRRAWAPARSIRSLRRWSPAPLPGRAR